MALQALARTGARTVVRAPAAYSTDDLSAATSGPFSPSGPACRNCAWACGPCPCSAIREGPSRLQRHRLCRRSPCQAWPPQREQDWPLPPAYRGGLSPAQLPAMIRICSFWMMPWLISGLFRYRPGTALIMAGLPGRYRDGVSDRSGDAAPRIAGAARVQQRIRQFGAGCTYS